MVGLIKTLTFVMKKRVRQKTHARISNQLKERTSIETDRGNLNFRIDSDASIPRGPDNDKGEPETFEWISKFLQPGEVLIDIGANIGLFSINVSQYTKNKIFIIQRSSASFYVILTLIAYFFEDFVKVFKSKNILKKCPSFFSV